MLHRIRRTSADYLFAPCKWDRAKTQAQEQLVREEAQSVIFHWPNGLPPYTRGTSCWGAQPRERQKPVRLRWFTHEYELPVSPYLRTSLPLPIAEDWRN